MECYYVELKIPILCLLNLLLYERVSYQYKDEQFKRNLKNRTHYSLDDMINIKNLDINKIKIGEKSYKYILI